MNNEVLLCRADGHIEAEIIVDALKNNGIYAYYKNNSPLQVMEHIAGDISQEQLIFINEDDLATAQETLKELKRNDFQYDENDALAEAEYEEDSTRRRKRINRVIAEIAAGLLVAAACIAWVILTK